MPNTCFSQGMKFSTPKRMIRNKLHINRKNVPMLPTIELSQLANTKPFSPPGFRNPSMLKPENNRPANTEIQKISTTENDTARLNFTRGRPHS